jgi:hypothetical protein
VRNLNKPRDFTVASHTQLVGDWRGACLLGGHSSIASIKSVACSPSSCRQLLVAQHNNIEHPPPSPPLNHHHPRAPTPYLKNKQTNKHHTHTFTAVLDDPEINTVVEVMGGVTDAKEVVFGAIQKGKHVVTANKALLAKHLPEITALLKEHPEVKFAYEAAVCGGIPIIHTLQNDYLGDQISQVRAGVAFPLWCFVVLAGLQTCPLVFVTSHSATAKSTPIKRSIGRWVGGRSAWRTHHLRPRIHSFTPTTSLQLPQTP